MGIDIVQVQEPWWSSKTKTHPGYQYPIPQCGENVRPRTVTYTRIDEKGITAIQVFPSSIPTGDYCWVKINGVMFLNVYKAHNDNSAIEPLINWTPTSSTTAAGDFNSVHWAWQPTITRSYGHGEEIEN